MQVVVSISLVTIGCIRTPGAGGVLAEMRTISSVAPMLDRRVLHVDGPRRHRDTKNSTDRTPWLRDSMARDGEHAHTFSSFTRNPLYSGAKELGSTIVGVTRFASEPC